MAAAGADEDVVMGEEEAFQMDCEEEAVSSVDAYGLTLFDRECTPLAGPDESKPIEVRWKNGLKLSQEFMTCPVCLSIISDTRTVMECLHRFCSRCIDDSLQRGKRECPSCRVKIPSHRYLRADPRFDDLVCKLLGGDVERFEEIQSEAVAQINKNFNRDALQRSIEDGLKRQLLARKREEYALRKKRKLTLACCLQPHPNETELPALAKPYVLSSERARVDHLTRYVRLKLFEEAQVDADVQLCVPILKEHSKVDEASLDETGKFVELDDRSLKTIEKYWAGQRPDDSAKTIPVYYRKKVFTNMFAM